MSQVMMTPTWSWNADMSTYPKDTYVVIRTIEDGQSTEGQPLTRRVWGIYEPVIGTDGEMRYQYDEALKHASSMRLPKGKSWAIVRASQDIAEEEQS